MEAQDRYESLLQKTLKQTDIMGLLEGKMGACVYYFIMGKKDPLSPMTQKGEALLTEIINTMHGVKKLDVTTGVTGIALGITYLIKNKYVEGCLNEILEDVDNFIYKSFCYSKDQMEGKFYAPLIDILAYQLQRYKDLEQGRRKELVKELLIILFNQIYIQRETDFYHEPLPFNLQNEVCIYLWELVELYRLGIERERILHVFHEMKYFLFAQHPILHSNRLSLAVATTLVGKTIADDGWLNFSERMIQSIDFDKIWHEEMGEKSVFPFNGVTGIAMLTILYNHIKGEKKLDMNLEQLKQRILVSSIWKKLENDHAFFFTHFSLNGYCGICLFLEYLKGGVCL